MVGRFRRSLCLCKSSAEKDFSHRCERGLWWKWRVPHSDTVLFWGAWCCMSNGKGAPHPRACSHQHYAGWLCRIAPCSARDPERKRGMEAHQDANLEIPKHSGLAGSSRDQVQSRTHARIQALRLCCHHHCRSRATTSYSQRPIRPRPLRLKDHAAAAIWNAVLAV